MIICHQVKLVINYCPKKYHNFFLEKCLKFFVNNNNNINIPFNNYINSIKTIKYVTEKIINKFYNNFNKFGVYNIFICETFYIGITIVEV